MVFAEGTTVDPSKSRAEIERLLRRYKCEAYGYAEDSAKAMIMFTVSARRIRFELRFPDPKAKRFTRYPGNQSWKSYTDVQAANRYEQEIRRLWRALLLTIKAKLEAAESGIETFEEAFMSHIVMPDGKSFGEHALPAITRAYESGSMPTFPLLGSGE